MTKQEHLMTIIMEECAEVAQRVSKAMRFGMDQIQQDADDAPEQNPERLSNRERVMSEYYHLRAVMRMAGFDPLDTSYRAEVAERQKVNKVEKYLERSKRCGTLAVGRPPRSGAQENTCRYCGGVWAECDCMHPHVDGAPRSGVTHEETANAEAVGTAGDSDVACDSARPIVEVGPVRVPGLDHQREMLADLMKAAMERDIDVPHLIAEILRKPKPVRPGAPTPDRQAP